MARTKTGDSQRRDKECLQFVKATILFRMINTILIYIYKFHLLFAHIPTLRDANQDDENFNQRLPKIAKDCPRLFKEMFEASTKIINNYLAAHQQTFSSLELTTICLGQNKILSRNLSQLYWWLVFGKLDIDLKTYEFSCYTANMCYDPRQFWPTPTKDSYFPSRKLDLKRFAEATTTIWRNIWIRLQFMWMVPPLPTCHSSVKRISVNFALLCLSDIMIKILKESQFTVESGSLGECLLSLTIRTAAITRGLRRRSRIFTLHSNLFSVYREAQLESKTGKDTHLLQVTEMTVVYLRLWVGHLL